LQPHSVGIQLADENLGRRPMPFMAKANLERLDALRARFDPEGRFNNYMGRVS
jgi:FAD/FMN-containing dehydrogenase